MEVFAKYFAPGSTGESVGTAIAVAMTNAFGLTPGAIGPDQLAHESISEMFNTGWILGEGDLEDADAPKGFLNYILFDEDLIPYDMGWDQIDSHAEATPSNPNPPHDTLSLQAVARKPGYVYIYFSNEDDEVIEMFFDDLHVEHVKGVVVQMDDYYPGGAVFNDYERESSIENNNRYQGKEWQDELGLNQYDNEWRQYDPFIWRTTTIDPHAERYLVTVHTVGWLTILLTISIRMAEI